MPQNKNLSRLSLVVLIVMSLFVNACSHIPWVGGEEKGKKDKEEDMTFEDQLPPLDEKSDAKAIEDEVFAEPPAMDAKTDKKGKNSIDAGFTNFEQETTKSEMKVDVAALQEQQQALTAKVRELQEIISTLEPKISATQERLEGSLGGVSGKAEFLEPEVNELKTQVARLNEEIVALKARKSEMTALSSHSGKKTPHGGGSKGFKAEYAKALESYKQGKYDESIMMFQNLAMKNPPKDYQDNIIYWIGSNYSKLEMFDDAINQFQNVLANYPRGNKTHDSRFMLGASLLKKGDAARAKEVLQSALKGNPPREVREKIEKQLSEIH